MRKVIRKCKLKNRDAFEKQLSDIDIDFGPVLWQHDRVYAPRGYKRGANAPRMVMRTEMKAVDKPAQYVLILRRHIEDSGVDIVNKTQVRDYTEMVRIIHQLGFEQIAESSRRRQMVQIGDGVALYLDKIEGVPGYYAKLETIVDEDDKISEVVEDLEKTLEVFGQDREMIVEQTDGELVEKFGKRINS